MFHASKLLKAELPVSLRLMGLRISHFQGESVDSSQRTLSDFFRTDSGQPCNKPDMGNCSPVCDRYEVLQKTSCTQVPQAELRHREVISERAEFGGQPSLACQSSENVISPRLDQQLGPVAECSGTFNTACDRDQVADPLEKSENKGDVSSSYKRGTSLGDFSFQTDDYDRALECRLLSAMKWVDDNHCSLCKLEIPASFTYERQEHMDFHFAQMLQQEYSSGGSVEELSRSSKEESKRLHSPSRKEMPPKKGRLGRAESSKEKSRHLPIDAFFSKTHVQHQL